MAHFIYSHVARFSGVKFLNIFVVHFLLWFQSPCCFCVAQLSCILLLGLNPDSYNVSSTLPLSSIVDMRFRISKTSMRYLSSQISATNKLYYLLSIEQGGQGFDFERQSILVLTIDQHRISSANFGLFQVYRLQPNRMQMGGCSLAQELHHILANIIKSLAVVF